jgi:hypothetical protein
MLENNSYVCAFAYLPTYVKTSQSTMYRYTIDCMNLLYVGFTHFQIVKDLSNKALIEPLTFKLLFKGFVCYRNFILYTKACESMLLNSIDWWRVTGSNR